MDWLFIAFIGVFAFLIVLIILFLVSLSKQGDERYEHIKTKAMVNSFYATVGALLGKLCLSIFNIGNQPNRVISNLSLLIVVAIVFLVSLGWQKRKYGG